MDTDFLRIVLGPAFEPLSPFNLLPNSELVLCRRTSNPLFYELSIFWLSLTLVLLIIYFVFFTGQNPQYRNATDLDKETDHSHIRI